MSPNRFYTRGRRAEYRCVQDLREAGFCAQRTAGSHSPFDVIAWTRYELLLVQVKRIKDASQVLAAIQRAARAWNIHDMPRIAYVRVELWIYHRGDISIFDLRALPDIDETYPGKD